MTNMRTESASFRADDLLRQFEESGDPTLLEEAVRLYSDALAEVDANDHEFNIRSFIIRTHLAKALIHQYLLTGSEVAHARFTRVMQRLPEAPRRIASRHAALVLFRHYRDSGERNSALLKEALEHYRFTRSQPANDQDTLNDGLLDDLRRDVAADDLLNRGNRLQRTGGLEGLAQASDCYQRALSLYPAGSWDHALILSLIAEVLEQSFDITGDLASLTRAIECYELALAGLGSSGMLRHDLEQAKDKFATIAGQVWCSAPRRRHLTLLH